MNRKLLNKVLGILGYKLVKLGKDEKLNLYNPEYLATLCNPKTVIDVGVAYGTYSLYEAYPSAHFILIEPVEEYKSTIDKILTQYNGTVHYTAVGDKKGVVEIDVDLDNLILSSHFNRTELSRRNSHKIEKRSVELTPLDDIPGLKDSIQRPFVLKIDTEGNELNVLKGAELTLQSADFVILEASIAQRFEGSYTFEELMNYMSDKGFYLYSILKVAHAPREARPRFADILFARAS